MKSGLILALSAVSLFSLEAQDKRKPKPAEIEVVELKIERSADRVSLDGRVKNNGETAVRGVQLLFHFLGPDGKTLATKRSGLETDPLPPGEEEEFHLETLNTARSVRVLVEVRDYDERVIKVIRPGPHDIQ